MCVHLNASAAAREGVATQRREGSRKKMRKQWRNKTQREGEKIRMSK